MNLGNLTVQTDPKTLEIGLKNKNKDDPIYRDDIIYDKLSVNFSNIYMTYYPTL